MPITHGFDALTGVLVVSRTGSITLGEDAELLRALAADPSPAPGRPVLVDCTGVEPPDPVQLVKAVAALCIADRDRPRCGRVALLVGSEAEYGMARMFQVLVEEAYPGTRVFRRRERALAWLRTGEIPAEGGPPDGPPRPRA